MKYLITGHRSSKLDTYDTDWIRESLLSTIENLQWFGQISYAYSGMASGVDLWFCEFCRKLNIPYCACIPFEGQELYMDSIEAEERKMLIEDAAEVKEVKNSYMVEHADAGIVVWDGNKGGTHNVLQQLIEKNKPFTWINPVGKKVWNCN